MFLERKFIFITTLISVIICISLLLLKIYVSLSFLPDISGSETSTIFPIQRLLAGLPIYTDSEEPQFLMTQYAPIYFVISSGILKIAGLLPSDVHKVFIMSRLISISFTLITVSVVWVILHKQIKASKLVATLASCFIFQILSFWFLTSSRPDSLLVLLTSVFIYSVFEATEHKNRNNIWYIVAIFIGVTAFFVKQSGAIHSITLGLFCILQAQWKLLFKLIGFGILFFVVYLFILPIASLDLFFMNIVGGVANSASWGWFYDWTLQRLLLQFGPLLAINTVLIIFIFRDKQSPFFFFLAICTLTFFFFSTLTALKIGAGVGYYQDYLIVAVVLLVGYFSKNYLALNFGNSFNILVTCMYLFFVSVHCLLYVYMSYTRVPLSDFKGKYIEEMDIANFLIKEKGLKNDEWVYVCTAEEFKGYYLNHFLYRNSLAPFSDIVFLADRNHTFNFAKLKDLVNKREVKYVISVKNKEPVTILGQKFPGLKKIQSTPTFDIYQGY